MTLAIAENSRSRDLKLAEIVVREMTDDEFKRYCRFSFENFVVESAKSSGRPIEEVRKRVGNGPDSRSVNDLWLIVLVRNEEAGFVWFQHRRDLNEAFGYDIFLKPKFRSQGIGRETIKHCAEFVRNHGILRVKVCVFEDNKIARSLYQSLGFKEIGFNSERRQHTLELTI